jgi:hypothetical protein
MLSNLGGLYYVWFCGNRQPGQLGWFGWFGWARRSKEKRPKMNRQPLSCAQTGWSWHPLTLTDMH